jgi:hypothetical protein
MQTRITREEMLAAARQLARSEEGKVALRQLTALMEGGNMGLDLLNQRAFLALLGGAWAGQVDVARDSIRDALAEAKR